MYVSESLCPPVCLKLSRYQLSLLLQQLRVHIRPHPTTLSTEIVETVFMCTGILLIADRFSTMHTILHIVKQVNTKRIFVNQLPSCRHGRIVIMLGMEFAFGMFG